MCALASIVKLASSCARSARNGMSPSNMYICSLSLFTKEMQHHTVKPQMTAHPPMVASTVTMASLVFCASDSMSIFLYFYDFIFQIWA